MKTQSMAYAGVAGAIVLVAALAAYAQQTDLRDANDQNNQAVQTNRNFQDTRANATDASGQRQDIGKLDDETMGATVRVSELMGADIKNSKGEDVGEINDLVIDSNGRVRYAAVTYGGFLGLGDKLFAVPFEAFRVNVDPEEVDDDEAAEADDYVLMLDVTQEQLEGAEGFDEDRWPDFANTNFTQELDRRYKIHRDHTRTTTRPQDAPRQ